MQENESIKAINWIYIQKQDNLGCQRDIEV